MNEKRELDIDQQEEGSVAPEEVFGKKRPWLTYATLAVVTCVLAVAFVYFVIYPLYLQRQKTDEAANPQKPPVEEKISIGQIYKISDLTVNPKNSMGRRFAVFEIALSVPDQKTIETLKIYEPVLRDRYINYFRSKTVEELSMETITDSIKQDLHRITESILGKPEIDDIYFTRYVLQ